jgi:hypothetical protein
MLIHTLYYFCRRYATFSLLLWTNLVTFGTKAISMRNLVWLELHYWSILFTPLLEHFERRLKAEREETARSNLICSLWFLFRLLLRHNWSRELDRLASMHVTGRTGCRRQSPPGHPGTHREAMAAGRNVARKVRDHYRPWQKGGHLICPDAGVFVSAHCTLHSSPLHWWSIRLGEYRCEQL